ncbi:hypothetical protein PACTADRAFT_42517 [Pachysolen tannophilus NRRL Y-2460]|uniref:Sedoheptulose 1,7-bisphosphatase n=1 Tax=Pachysolen tannophilus NRRL Y-2460 TaxID=669874 RepID=A0A1E4TUQ2_PACTA|nr:hypothetical protein PACTADRAFT_42517 [Pachysolen tannophilus NRRL Y-2460]
MTKAPVPRVIFVRHGQTEWSKSGQYTSVTDLPLTPFGVKQMSATGEVLIGDSNVNLIKPSSIKYIFTSPRLRAKTTAQLLTAGISEQVKNEIKFSIDERIREWDYGNYEGLTTAQIKQSRASRGLNSDNWSIWEYGCEGGEDYSKVTQRLDEFIKEIVKIQKKALENEEICDILIVAHGHILRCLAARWIGLPLNKNPQFMLDAGGVGVLSYQHRNINEQALFLPGAFVVPIEEEGGDL